MTWNSSLWNLNSPVWLVAFAIVVAYLAVLRGAGMRRLWLLALAMGLLVLAFVSPIGVLADGYLFSAHIVQHLLLLLVVPMCLLLCLPQDKVASWFTQSPQDRVGRWLSVPLIGWICGIGAMWFWHVPSFCSAAAQNNVLGGVRDVTFLFAGLAFWWPIYAPVEKYRLPPLSGITYLFSACLGCTLLGIYITFTTILVCPAFANPTDRLGILNMLHDAGLTPGMDQHLGGLLMWVPPCSLYVCASLSLLCRWYSVTGQDPESSRNGESDFQLDTSHDGSLPT